MSQPIFREKSLQKVKSPDDLDEYIRIANPSVWLILVTIIILLLGFCIWAAFGSINTEVKANALCSDGVITCYLSETDAEKVHVGMPVQIGKYTGTVSELVVRDGDISTCIVAADNPIPDGVYRASITVESIHPAFFLTN